MDPASAIGVAAAVVQFLDLSIKVAKRINEYVQASPGDVPKPLENITTTLPLITKSLSQLQEDAKLEAYDSDTRMILHGVVLGCYRLAGELDDITNKIGLKHGESLGVKLKKVLHSLKNEERIWEIDRGLQAFIQVLILHRVVNKKDVHLLPAKDVTYFEVKKLRAQNPRPRTELVAKLHEAFSATVSSSNDVPVFVRLQGTAGGGKSQLALEYCHEAYGLNHYPAIFWLDSSTPATLRLSLEHVASVIRQSKLGSPEEKLHFTRSFLAESWHPWLLVLDNYSRKAFDDEPLESLLPDSGHGAVLITTRDAETPEPLKVVTVHKALTEEEDEAFREEFAEALRDKDMSAVIDALTRGFNVDNYSVAGWSRQSSPLVNVAARLGFDEALKLMLEMGANPHPSKNEGSVLSCGASSGHVAIVDTCLDFEESTGYSFSSGCWDSATRHCLLNSHTDILKTLLARRLHKVDLGGHWAGEGFTEAAEKGDLEIIKILLTHDKFPTKAIVKATALTKALKHGRMHVVDFLLHEAHFDPNATNDMGNTLLMEALGIYIYKVVEPSKASEKIDREERKELIKMILDSGADINARDYWHKKTVVHVAVDNYVVSAMPLLFERGANVLLENEDGENALGSAARLDRVDAFTTLFDAPVADTASRKKFVRQALFIAARKSHRELMVKALAEIDINTREEKTGWTALLLAIDHKDLPMARLLVRKGADQNLPDKDGELPLSLAAKNGMDTLIKELVKAKNCPSLEVPVKNGLTPLMLAVQKRHLSTVQLLCQLGADKDAMNDFGDTAMDLAEDPYDKDIVAVLSDQVVAIR